MKNYRTMPVILFILFILLNSTFAFAYAPENVKQETKFPQTTNHKPLTTNNQLQPLTNNPQPLTISLQATTPATQPTTQPTTTPTTPTQPVEVIVPQPVAFECQTDTLSTEEAQKYIDHILRAGFLGKKLSSGEEAIPHAQREKVEGDILKADAKGRMHKVSPKNRYQIFQKELRHFMDGGFKVDAFSFGLVLDDTKRVGRCKDLADKNILCPLEEKALRLRNSGEGIVEDFAPIVDTIKDIVGLEEDITDWSEEDYDNARKKLGLPPDKDVKIPLSSKLVMADEEADKLMHFKRKVTDLNHIIHNTMQAERFDAKFATNCNVSGTKCTISVYSMFDKFYNRWYSSVMVISTFAPALLNRAGKLITKMSYSGEADLTFGKWPWSRPYRRAAEWVRAKLYDPAFGTITKLGQRRGGRIYAAMEKYPEIGRALNPLFEPGEWTSKYLLTKGTEFRQWFRNDFLSKGGFMDEIAKQPRKVRKTFLKAVKDVRGLSRAQASLYWRAKRAYLKVYDKYGLNSAEEIAARIKYGIEAGKAARGYDHAIRLDIGEWMIQKDEGADLFHYFLKAKGENRYLPIYRDPAQLNRLEGKFWKDGHFQGHWPSAEKRFMPEAYETTGKSLNLYEVKPGKLFDRVAVEDIHKQPALYNEKVVKTDMGHFIKADHGAVGHLRANAGPKVEVYDYGGFEKAMELKPEDFAGKYLTSRAEMTIASEPWRNSEQMYNALLRQGFSGRRYSSWLDKAFSEQDELIKSYFHPLGGMKKTAQMYGYWYLKRGGIPGVIDTPFSGYMKQEDFKTIKFPLGSEELYNDAFIDFFAQHGSDQGDIFVRALSYLPWDMILNAATEKLEVADDTFKTLTGKGIRYKVENIADFVNSPGSCTNCYFALDKNTAYSVVQNKPEDIVAFTYHANSPITSDMIEYITSEEAQHKGTTLIAFARHTDIAGDTRIDLADAMKRTKCTEDKKCACTTVVRKMTHGIPLIGSILTTESVGGLLAFGESLGYYIFGLSGGLFGTAFQQFYLAPQLQDCVDTEGGYYAQISAPPKKLSEIELAKKKIVGLQEEISLLRKQIDLKENEKAKLVKQKKKSPKLEKEIKSLQAQLEEKKQDVRFIQQYSSIKGKSVAQLSTQKVFDTIKDFQGKVMMAFGGAKAPEALQGINKQVENFLKSNEVDNMVQATVVSQGHVSGREEGPILFDFWFRGERASTKLPEEGQVIFEPKFGPKLKKDYAKGSLSATGTAGELIKIIHKPEARALLQLESTNTRSAAVHIPNTGTRMSLPNNLLRMFEYKNNGQFLVHNENVLSCIQKGVLAQTAVPLTSNDLVDVFGDVLDVRTDMGYHIHAHPSANKILASGSPSLSVTGKNARAEILGNRSTILKNSSEKKAGKMISVVFQYGEMVYNPKTDELLVLLRRNARALLHQSDVAGLRPLLTTDTNPLTNCPEPAINLEALPVAGSELKQVKADRFNQSIKSAGPFKVFETPTKRYIFYSKLEEGECVDYFKIIDKTTGKTLYDGPIKPGTMKQTPTGVEFETKDGKKHKLDFSAPGGVPQISYNNQAPETFTSAQGRNGSFWYDPKSGMWYPENGHLLPLIEAFRNGIGAKVGPDGKTSLQASTGWQHVEVKPGTGTPFNLPSMPENILHLFLFIALMLACIVFIRIRIEKLEFGKKRIEF